MASLSVDTPDGKSLTVDIPNGTNPSQYGAIAEEAVRHYSANAVKPYFDTEKAISNIPSDAIDTAKGLAQTALTASPDSIIGSLPSLIKQGAQMLSNPKQTAQSIAEPVIHPLAYAENHPVKQAMNVLGLISGLRSAISSEAPAAENSISQRLAARTTSQALDINPLAARKLSDKLGVSPEQAVLDLGTKANELIPDLITPLDSANSKFTKVLNAHDDAGKALGDITKQTSGNLPEATDTISALRDAAKNYYGVDGGETALQKTADRLETLQKDGKLDFNRFSQVKSAIGKGFSKKDVPPGTDEVYDILNNGVSKVVDRLSVQNPDLAPQFDTLKQIYTTTSRLLPAMSRTAAREVAGNSIGSGVVGKAIPAAIGGMIGGVPGAVLAGGAKYLQEAIAPDLGKNLAYIAMKSAPGAIDTASKIPIAMAASNVSNIQDPLINDLIDKLKKKFQDRQRM